MTFYNIPRINSFESHFARVTHMWESHCFDTFWAPIKLTCESHSFFESHSFYTLLHLFTLFSSFSVLFVGKLLLTSRKGKNFCQKKIKQWNCFYLRSIWEVFFVVLFVFRMDYFILQCESRNLSEFDRSGKNCLHLLFWHVRVTQCESRSVLTHFGNL